MPIDVSYPTPLLEDIFADSQPTAVISEQSLIQYIPGRIPFSFEISQSVFFFKLFFFPCEGNI